jgi:predicted phage baseplate assembly protein
MTRGRLEPPNLDDRTWREIVDQARALIPRYAPEWTDHNPSDLGITLIELFAWIAEGMIYRLNRVPDRSLVQFLNLLGITRAPATPATTWLTFKLSSGASPTIVPAGSRVTTTQNEQAAPIIFETDADLRALPINLTKALLLDGTSALDVTGALVAAPLGGLLLDLPSGQSVLVALGFDASAPAIALHLQRSRADGKDTVQTGWRCATAEKNPKEWLSITPESDTTDGLSRSGSVALRLPGDWEKQKPASWAVAGGDAIKDELFWLGLRIEPAANTRLHLRLDHILFNSVAATNALTINQPELLGIGDDTPFQTFTLANRPLYRRIISSDAYDHLVVEVREQQTGGSFGPWVRWTRVEHLAPGAGQSYRLDPVTGTIAFGDYNPSLQKGHGSIPRLGSEIRAGRYRYVVGGARGNVGPGSINGLAAPLGGVASVTNPGAARGGADEESTEQATRRAPELLGNRSRAVTIADNEYLAREAAPDISKLRCLPPRLFTAYESDFATKVNANVGEPWTFGGLDRGIGTVNLIIVPQAALETPRPTPSRELIVAVDSYMEAHRPLASHLVVTGPRYLPVGVTVEVSVWRRALALNPLIKDDQKRTITAEVQRFLHPLLGGKDRRGWEIGQELLIADLLESIKPDSSIGFISSLLARAEAPAYLPPVRPFAGAAALGAWVQLADYELVCGGAIEVTFKEI